LKPGARNQEVTLLDTTEEEFMNAMILNRILLVVGIIGLPICIFYARRSQSSAPFLIGIGLFGYLVISSVIVEIRQVIQK
jgi:hypothetical protein